MRRASQGLWWIPALLLTGLLLELGRAPKMARADQAYEVRILQVALEDFPLVDIRVWVWNPAQRQVPANLPRQAFTVLENGTALPPQQVRVIAPGLVWVVALNPDRPFALRDAQGVSRYEYVVYQLASWLERQPQGRHLLALYIANGPQIRGTADPQQLLEALWSYTPSREPQSPNLAPLQQALQLALQDPPRPLMRRSVLFITAPVAPAFLNGLDALAQQAQRNDIQVSVWLVGPPERLQAQQQAWEAFVAQTRGHLALFSGTEVLPDLNQELLRYNRLYGVQYISQMRQTGNVDLQVQVEWEGHTGRSPAHRLALNLQPPLPQVGNLPERILRTPAKDNPQRLTPVNLHLNLKVTFPDGLTRDLTRATLLVNGEPVFTTTTPPFDNLRWDLTPYTSSQEVEVVVEVEDILGLKGRTEPQRVRIEVRGSGSRPEQPAAPAVRVEDGPDLPQTRLAAEEEGFSWAPVLLSGIVLLLIVLWASWRSLTYRRPTPSSTRPAPARKVSPHGKRWALELRPLHPEDGITGFRLVQPQVVVGADPEQAQWVLQDPSLSPRHARFWYHPEEHRYYVADLGSVAGTWVNYAPVSSTGLALESGDLLLLGRVGFRVEYVPWEPLPPTAETPTRGFLARWWTRKRPFPAREQGRSK